MASVPKPDVNTQRQDLYRRMDRHNLAPLWEVLHNLIPNEPSTPCKPALWKYREARPYLMEAGKLHTTLDQVFPLERLAEAHGAVAGGHIRGKVVIKITS